MPVGVGLAAEVAVLVVESLGDAAFGVDLLDRLAVFIKVVFVDPAVGSGSSLQAKRGVESCSIQRYCNSLKFCLLKSGGAMA